MKRLRETPPAAKPRRRRPEISPEDHALWVHVARSAKPMPGRQLPDLPEMVEPPEAAVIATATALPPPPAKARTLPPLAGIEKKLTRQITRGQTGLDARIDLHGMRQAEAHGALLAFIHRAHHADARLVLVITGKGGSSAGSWGDERGVLRRMVPHWLADPGMRQLVIGFEPASRAHGGEGALYVRIRRRRALG
jgi:DNA-nicking Smr family endonuclease